MHGVHGRVLIVDLANGRSETLPLPDVVYERLIGGVGLATYLLNRFCPPGIDPFSPENPLIFATSPFIGTGITTASKLAVATKSPQTGMIGDSLSSSYLAIAMKRTGFDAIVLRGSAPDWSYLVIDDDKVELRRASDLLGLDPTEMSDKLRAQLGNGFRVAAIGVAGERLVRYASICNDGRLAGRTGGGTVMGSKWLKAIAVRGSGLPTVANPRGLTAAARRLAERSLGPETAKYREIGTAANVAFFNRIGILPTNNFQTGNFARAEAIAGETLLLEHRVDRHACAACTVGCEHHYKTRDGGTETETRLEYETLFALGSLCGVSDPNIILRAAARCDQLGIDAISTGVTIAWAMECREQSVDLGVPDAELPVFGDGASILATIEAIGERRGIGDLLAEGSRTASERTGQGSDAWAMHVKGLEMPGYDPRKLPTLALGLAVSTRGACHNRSSAYEADLSDRIDREAAANTRATAAAASEDQAALLDSLTVCKFLRHCFDDLPAETGDLYELVTGVEVSGPDMLLAGERINNLKKLFNIRQGWTCADDTLPPRVFENLEAPSLLTQTWLSDQIDAYYRVRGWDADGMISDGHLHEIGLSDLI
jgi:aldehyde:ferredoxin oxidoreductase